MALMRRHELCHANAALALALGALLLAAAASGVAAQPQHHAGLAGARSSAVLMARHRFRHHRRGVFKQQTQEESPQPKAKSADSPPSAPRLQLAPGRARPGEAGKDVTEKPADKTREPMGPPAPPERWTEAEIEAARMDCDRRLSRLDALFDRLDPIKEGVCGLAAPIRLKGFENGREPKLMFSPAPTVSCKLAEALRRWAVDVVEPGAKKHLNADIAGITVLSSYNCRSRYDDPFQRMSQHAYANAIDISEFVTAKGERIGVLDHWNGSGERSAFLHAIHGGACEIFGTTLGPEANAAHKNHFHLDMKERRRPLCDFTPEQVRAREDAKKHPPVPLEAAKPSVSGTGKPGVSSLQVKIVPKPAILPEKEKPGVTSTAQEPPAAGKEHHRRHRRHRRYGW